MAFSSCGTKYSDSKIKSLSVWGFFPLFGYGFFLFFLFLFLVFVFCFFKHNAVKTVQAYVLLVIGLKLIFMYPNASIN
uniref:Macaca fascicularis brain cDNA clone: QflA-16622, similar to human retinoblastoma binding protein 6 (RBBP6), transcriptvariant 3, mRNA, RefSeq: NM_032626.5 n=1 Tax=Macaca fascicularis TaxID=9541 RepID=I7GBG1_MACFA|nr:unnamed protein product [Macaca fascicularis]